MSRRHHREREPLTPTRLQLQFMQTTLTNDEVSTDEELALHFTHQGVPDYLARFYVSRHRSKALSQLVYCFDEPDPLMAACVRIALTPEGAEGSCAHFCAEVLRLAQVRDSLINDLAQMGFGTDEPVSGAELIDLLGRFFRHHTNKERTPSC